MISKIPNISATSVVCGFFGKMKKADENHENLPPWQPAKVPRNPGLHQRGVVANLKRIRCWEAIAELDGAPTYIVSAFGPQKTPWKNEGFFPPPNIWVITPENEGNVGSHGG